MKTVIFILALAGLAFGQIYPPVGYPGGYPGGYPPPGYPGGYPPGYPGGYPPGSPGGTGTGTGTGNPAPRKGKKQSQSDQVLPNFRGKLKEMDSKSIRLSLGDDRILDFHVNGKTKYLKNGDEVKSPKFNPGDQLSVEASEEPDGTMLAVNVYWEKAGSSVAANAGQKKDGTVDAWKVAPQPAPPNSGTAAPSASATQPNAPQETHPPAPRDPDDPGPPTLKYGKPVERASNDAPPSALPPKAPPQPQAPPPQSPAPATQPAPLAPAGPPVELPSIATAASIPPAGPDRPRLSPAGVDDQSPLGSHEEDPLIRKATEAALEFTQTLPAYVCQEMMSRFQSESRPASWEPQDVITVEVVYENNRERYRNLAINGKQTNKTMEQLGGAWSTGEFGTVLIDLFSPATDAQFRPRGSSRIAGIDARLYAFRVAHENSHWILHFGSQTYQPAYSGSVWIDPQTARVLRIEMQAQGIPEQFPADTVESATDYQYVRLGGTQQFLLPVDAETLSCQRGSAYCSRNKIDFRNYHKYAGESTVEFGTVKDK